ncbi:MAG TPA: hypothetical protein VEY92_08640 [Pseudoxanthomonas sp.]|nr:hypothetical protein [Pseudoxanthomonas sp.]
MIAKDSGGGSFEQAPVGTHAARCYKLIDLGTTLQEFQGEAKKRHQVLIGWELPNELMTTGEFAGQPFTVSKFYTLSLHEKATLRGDLKNWRGRDFTDEELGGFDMKSILGKTCMVSVTHNDKGRSDVGAVMALPKGMPVPDAVNPTSYFSFAEFDQGVFDAFSEKMQALLAKSDEYKALGNKAKPSQIDEQFTDDVPF